METLHELRLSRAPRVRLGAREFSVPDLPLSYVIEIEAMLHDMASFDPRR